MRENCVNSTQPSSVLVNMKISFQGCETGKTSHLNRDIWVPEGDKLLLGSRKVPEEEEFQSCIDTNLEMT